MTTAVVTGGFGYAGGRIVRKLIDSGAAVRVSTRKQIADVPDWARQSVTWGDDYAALFEGADCAIHLAAPNEIECATNPGAAVEATVTLTRHAVGAALQHGVRRFIYMSTVHVYGPMQDHIDENTAPDPRHPYALAHLQSEQAVAAATENLDTVILRLSNGFGAPADTGPDRWSLLVNDLCRQAIEDRRLVLKSDGMQQRDFLPLGDVADAVAYFVFAPPHPTGVRVFNLSAGKAMHVRDMAELIRARAQELLGTEIELSLPAAAATAPQADLLIDNRRLLDTGFALTADPAAEIDAMLRFCMSIGRKDP